MKLCGVLLAYSYENTFLLFMKSIFCAVASFLSVIAREIPIPAVGPWTPPQAGQGYPPSLLI
jgi:hypothetical protein